jgi:Flp pilus assembly protein TadG
MSRLRRRDDRGLAVVEAAVIAPVLLTVLLLIFEYGLYFRDSLTTSDAVEDGARVGAIIGSDSDATVVNADYQILRTLRDATSGLDPNKIQRIVIFEATGSSADSPLDQIPTSCRNGTPSTRCTVYQDPGAAFAAVQSGDTVYFASCPPPTGACWDPSTRDEGPDPRDIDYLGVYIRYSHPALTGMFGSRTIEDAAVVRLEPGSMP